LVKLAEERGVDAPLTRTLVALLSPHADGAATA
jgi:hypothetical protein